MTSQDYEIDSSTARTDPDSSHRDDRTAPDDRVAGETRSGRFANPYRRSVIGFAAVGLVAAVGGLILPGARQVLFAFTGTALFGGVLAYQLSSDRFIEAAVGERLVASAAFNHAAIADDLGLGSDRLYVPGEETQRSRLYVPENSSAAVPADLTRPFVSEGDEGGLLLEPSGVRLVGEFERAVSGGLSTNPTRLSAQLADGLVEQFELASRVRPIVDDGRATFRVDDSVLGPVDRFDHPIASFLAVGLAVGLDRTITLDVRPGDDRADWLVTCRWDPIDD